MNWGKNNQTFQGVLSTAYGLTLIPGHSKCFWGLPVRVVVYVSQVINGVLDQVCLTVGPLSIQTHPMVISSVPEWIIGVTGRMPTLVILSNWQNAHIDSLTCGVKYIYLRK